MRSIKVPARASVTPAVCCTWGREESVCACVEMSRLDEYRTVYAKACEDYSQLTDEQRVLFLAFKGVPPAVVERHPRLFPAQAVQAVRETPAVQAVRETPAVQAVRETPAVQAAPEPPAQLRVPQQAPAELRAQPRKRGRLDTPLHRLLHALNVHCCTHTKFERMHPTRTLLVKPSKSERPSLFEKGDFASGGVDVYWSRKFDGHSVYLVFCERSVVKAFSATGKALPIRKVVDALREAFIPALQAEEFVIVKAEMCTMVEDDQGNSHEAGHEAVDSNQDPYRQTTHGHEARLVFHCFEVILVATRTEFTELDDFNMGTLSDFMGPALYSHELSPAQHTQLLQRLLRPTAFVSVVAWEKEGSGVLNQAEYTALKAEVCDKVKVNGWEGVVFWIKYAHGFPFQERLYQRDTSAKPGDKSVSILRNTVQFKWKDYVRPVFRLESPERHCFGRDLASMVCPWTGRELRRINLDDALHVHPRFKATLMGHMRSRQVLRAKAVKFSSKGMLTGLFQLNEQNVKVEHGFDPGRELQASNSLHEVLCKENRDLLSDIDWFALDLRCHLHYCALPS